jgi:uncharacterized repeat protein (TIGR02543 family)
VVDGASKGAVTSYTISNVQETHTVTASFAIDSFAITVTQGANGLIAGPSSVNYGADAAFTIAPSAGYHIVDVVVDGASKGAVTSYTISNVQETHTVTASFAIDSFAITVTQTANGQIAPDTTTVNYGATPSFTITPNAGYHIASITANGASVTVTSPSGQSYQFSAVSADGSLTATFAINTYTITVTSAHGNPTASASVNYGGSFTALVTSPESAGAGHQWVCTGYSIDGGSIISGTTYTFTNVNAAHSITFNWQEQYYLTVNNNGHGTANGQGWYSAGTTVQATISPLTLSDTTGTQYVFAGWAGDASGSSSTSNPILMNSAKTATANWTTQYQITFITNPIGGGTTTPSGTSTWISAGNLTISANLNANYAFISWTTTGSITIASPPSSSTTATISGPGTITANFNSNPTATPTPTPAPTPTATPTPTPEPTPSTSIIAIDTTNNNAYSIAISGNVTAQQISNMTITPYQSNATTTVTFTITGTSGTVGFGNMTIPKTAIPYGTSPVVYIDGQQAPNQGYSQDADNFYVWYTTHFSTHQVEISFTAGTTTQPQVTTLWYALVVIVVVAATTMVAIVSRRKHTRNNKATQ